MYFDFFGNDPFWGAQDYYASVARSLYWIIGLVIAAVILGIILNFTFLKKSNEGKFKGFWGKLYDLLAMNRFHTEDITKLLGVITFLMLTFLGIYMICTGSIAGGIAVIVFGNLIARVCFEMIIMFAIVTRKTVSMDRRLAGIEKFYSDDMKDWEDSEEASEDEAEEDDQFEEIVSDPNATFEEKLKATFGDLEDTQKYGYDEECRECDNWDEVSEDCYCEDDCLTCEKPDQDKAEKAGSSEEETAAESTEEETAAESTEEA